MNQIKPKHMIALQHAIMFVKPALAKTQNPRTRRAIQLDLDRLLDLTKIIREAYYNPELPLNIQRGPAERDIEYEKTQEMTPLEIAEYQDW